MIFKKYATTLQHDQSDCAAAAVFTVLKTYSKEYSIMKIREIIGTDMYGTTVKGVVLWLEKIKFNVKVLRGNLENFNGDIITRFQDAMTIKDIFTSWEQVLYL